MTNSNNSDDFPCIDCIVLPVCRAKIDDGDLFDLGYLMDRCKLLKKYTYDNNLDISTSVERVFENGKDSLFRGITFCRGIKFELPVLKNVDTKLL